MEGDLAGQTVAWFRQPKTIIFTVLVLLFAVFDYVHIAGIDSIAKSGAGYGHQEFVKSWPGAAETETVNGLKRVDFNFNHFIKWWIVFPPNRRGGIEGALTSDGNGLLNNLGGHLFGSAFLVFIALLVFRSIPMVVIAGTAMNIFHEYIAEGRFCDPSPVDLWLDQIGILLALAAYGIAISTVFKAK
jgi:hypothetical protein